MRVGFVGLGSMGAPIARNLCRAGHEVQVWNRTRQKAEPLVSEGAKIAESLKAVSQADVVFTMLADDSALESVVEGKDGIAAHLPRGAIHVSCSTISVALSERLTETHQQAGQVFVACPVFGRPEAASSAKLFLLLGGDKTAIERCQPLFQAIGQKSFVCGDQPSRANLVKLCGNFLLASVIEGLGETMALVRKQGMEPGQLLEILTETLFPAPVYKNYGGMIAQGKFEPAGFQLKLGLKDIRLIQEAARGLGAPLPAASVIHDRFLTAVARGYGELDWSGLAQISFESAGLR